MNERYIKLFTLFGDWLETQQYSSNTRASYLKIIRTFLSYLSSFNIQRLKDSDRNLILQFTSRQGDRLYAESNVRLRQSALGLFYAWACTNKFSQTNPIIEHRKSKLNIKLPTQAQKMEEKQNNDVIVVLTSEEQKALLSTVTDNDVATARNKCIISMVLMGALHVEEVITLLVSDVNLKDGYFNIGKQPNKQRRIGISLRTYKLACQDWLAIRESMLRGKKASLLFFTDDIQPISKRTLHKLISKAMIEAGINKVHMGTEILRQTAIANMLSSGKTIEEVQAVTGIKLLKNIQKYHRAYVRHKSIL